MSALGFFMMCRLVSVLLDPSCFSLRNRLGNWGIRPSKPTLGLRVASRLKLSACRTQKKYLDPVGYYRPYAVNMDGLTRGQLAQRAQVNPETVRFYEQVGLLPLAPRTASGYRRFVPAAVDRLAFVKRAKSLGFSLEEVRELLAIQDEHPDACVEVRDLLQKKLAVLRDKKRELEKLEEHVRAALRECDRALKRREPQHAESCPVLRQMAGSSSRKNHGGPHA